MMLTKKIRNRFFLLSIQIALIFSCLFVTRNSFSIDTIQVFIEQVSIEQLLSNLETTDSTKQKGQLLKQLKLDKLSLSLELSSSPVKLRINLSQVVLPAPYKKITTLDIACHDFILQENQIKCNKGQLSFKGLMAQTTTSADFNLDYDLANDDLILTVDNLNIAKGRLSLKFQMQGDEWQSTFNAEKLDYKFFAHFVKHYMYQADLNDVIDKLENPGAIVSFSGQVSGTLPSNSNADPANKPGLKAIELKGKMKNIHYQYGEELAEKLAFNFNFSLNSTSSPVQINKSNSSAFNHFKVSLSIDALKGEILQNDIYVVFNGKEKIRAKFNYRDEEIIEFSRFDILSKDIFTFNSRGKFNFKDDLNFTRLEASLDINNLSELNHVYLNNALSGTDYEGLKIEGGVASSIRKNLNKIKIKTQFNNFSLAFNEEISLEDLNGKVHWNNLQQKRSPVQTSQLSWQSLTLNQIPLGAAQFIFNTHNDKLKLNRETDIPVFDGALHINNLEISQIFPQSSSQTKNKNREQNNEGLTVTVDGMIKPVSLALLSNHFQWPLLDGTLSAVIPSTTYNEKQLTVGGALMLQLFDGAVIIKDLKIDEPLQDYAQLFANIDLNNLNLKSLTKTYNFGEIEGRVEGKVTGLELSAWEPVAFDAYIRTPENDKSRHRISQRAIDNLSSLGGASGLLSRSFLSFFETFRYDKIGISCRLKNNICYMSGIESKGNSYYIVKGGGIPRIDVMGFQRQVNWQVLTSRLKAIQLSNEAVIE